MAHTLDLERAPDELFAGNPGWRQMTPQQQYAAKAEFVESFNQSLTKVATGISEDTWELLGFSPDPALMELAKSAMSKDITTTSPLTGQISANFGFMPVDMEESAKLLYSTKAPIRQKITRSKGKGPAGIFNRVLGISNSQTGGVANLSPFSDEFEGADNLNSWPMQSTPPNVVQMAADRLVIPYKVMEMNNSVDFVAQMMGQGYQDNAGLATLVLMQAMLMGEERAMLSSFSGTISPPTITVTARGTVAGETAIGAGTIYVKVTAANLFGETAPTGAIAGTLSAGQVADIAITDAVGALGYNIYVSKGASDPGDASRFYAGRTGWNKFTLQGTLPSSGAVVPSADTGTGSSKRYDGFTSILSGFANATYDPASLGMNSGYSTRFNAALGPEDLQAALLGIYDKNFGDPDEVWMAAADRRAISKLILAASGQTAAYRFEITQNDAGGMTVGNTVTKMYNETTEKVVNVTVHPYLPQGNALVLSYSLPMISYSETPYCFENRMVTDMLAIRWPVIDPRYRYSLYSIGAFAGLAPQFSGLIQGIPLSATQPYS